MRNVDTVIILSYCFHDGPSVTGKEIHGVYFDIAGADRAIEANNKREDGGLRSVNGGKPVWHKETWLIREMPKGNQLVLVTEKEALYRD
jgi:hypothetical protein